MARICSPFFPLTRAFMVMGKPEASEYSGLNINIVDEGIKLGISGQWVGGFMKLFGAAKKARSFKSICMRESMLVPCVLSFCNKN